MCTGKSAFQAKKEKYLTELGLVRAENTAAVNVQNLKNAQYEINTKENVRDYSGVIGGIQRNFGLEVAQFMKNKETLFRQKTGKTPVNEGDRSTAFGRGAKLASLYEEGMQASNLRRADIKQTEDIRGAYKRLLSSQQQELGKKGLGPKFRPEPIKPKGPSFLDQALGIATTAASFISPVQTVGGAMGLGGKFFNPTV